MKPSFALNLTEEGVTLLHRTARGWLDVGYAGFDADDLPAALDYMRSTALGLSPKGLTTKLVIPNSQILYAQVDAPGPDEGSRRSQIEAALHGRTPYAVADLVYDWQMDGSTANVAVVARETLDEAEAFATEHRFGPVSFVASPEPAEGGFTKEPFFGPTTAAQQILPAGQVVERDQDPIIVAPRDAPKAVEADLEIPAEPVPESVAEVMVAPEPEAEPEPESVPEPDSMPEVPVVPEAASPEPAQPEPAQPEPAWPEPAQSEPAPTAPEPAAYEPTAYEPSFVQRPAPEPRPEPTPPPAAVATHESAPQFEQRPAPPMAKPEQAAPPPPPVQRFAARSLDLPELDEAPMAVDVSDDDDIVVGPTPKSPPPFGAPKADGARSGADDVPPLSPAAMLAFASRRKAETQGQGAGVADTGLRVGGGTAGGRPAPAAGLVARPLGSAGQGMAKGAAAKPVVDRPPAARPPPKFSYDDPVPPPPRMPGDPPGAASLAVSKGPRPPVSAPVHAGKAKARPASDIGAKPAGAVVDAPAAAPRAAAPSNAARAPQQTAVQPDALARGLASRSMARPGKPRFLGLILTGVLLLFLALVAAWSSYYLTQRNQEDAPVAVAAANPGTASTAIEAPSPLVPEVTPDPTPVPEATSVAEAPEPAPQTGVDTTVADSVPPASADLAEALLAGPDAPPALSEPAPLADPAVSGDAVPAPQMPPPPFGTVYAFDENGWITPTPEGIVTPEGVRLVAGTPPRQPPVRPASVTAAAAAAAPTVQPPAEPAEPAVAQAPTPAAAEGAILPEQTFAADPALANARPRTRPANLAPPETDTAADTLDDAAVATAQPNGFASLRPRPRPQTILVAGQSARLAAASASLVASAAADEAALIQASAQISPQAVSVSRVPAPRPRNLSRAVEAAVAAASRQPAAPAPSAKAEDEADDEPEVVTAAPRIPTRANVAKQATYVNAINLSKINLIGVYGSQSKRYALIRQANGRYKKVGVGDKIDGGRIQAITASEVRYQKGGRLIALGMPKG